MMRKSLYRPNNQFNRPLRPSGVIAGMQFDRQGRKSMSLSSAEIAAASPVSLEPEKSSLARLRDRAAAIVMIGSNIFNILALVVMSPLVAAVAAHFAEHAVNGVVFTVLGYPVGVQIAAQLMITLLNIGIMFAGPLLGLLAERVGYARLLSAALAIYAVAGSAGLYLDLPVSLLLSRLVLGLTSASISICCYSLIAERYKGEERARMLGYQSALVMLTGLVALFGAGAIADLGGWRAPFALYLLAVPMLALSLFALSGKTAEIGPVAERVGIAVLLPLWPLYLVLIPFNVAIYMTSVHLPFVLVSDGITRPSIMGLIMASSFLMNILTSYYYSRIAARMTKRWIFVLLIGIFAASDMIIGLSDNWIGTTVGCWVAGLGGGLMTPFFVNIILNRAPEAARARAIGLMYTMMYVGDFANPLLITPLRLRVGNHQVFAIMGLIMIGAAIIQALFRRSPLGIESRQPA
jgi:MFS family permease